MNKVPKEVKEDNKHDGSLELDCMSLSPFEINEDFIKDILELLPSQIAISQIIFLCH